MFLKKAIKINFGSNYILNSLIAELESAFNNVFLKSALSGNLSIFIHSDVNAESQPLNVGIQGRYFHYFSCKHMINLVWKINRSCSFCKFGSLNEF